MSCRHRHLVGYFMYTKVTAQNQEMFKLSKRCEAI